MPSSYYFAVGSGGQSWRGKLEFPRGRVRGGYADRRSRIVVGEGRMSQKAKENMELCASYDGLGSPHEGCDAAGAEGNYANAKPEGMRLRLHRLGARPRCIAGQLCARFPWHRIVTWRERVRCKDTLCLAASISV